MARKICTAGVVGLYSFFILDRGKDVVVAVNFDGQEKIITHTEMEVAEKWKDKQIEALVGIRYETD